MRTFLLLSWTFRFRFTSGTRRASPPTSHAGKRHCAPTISSVASQDTIREHPVVKVIRYGLMIQAFPDVHTAELCDQQIARWQEEHAHEPKRLWAEE
jgi:hypothetical protein